ncbi:MAG: hypothetical protein VKJ44_03495 [Synechococcus sp.]|nr:hypothetical protein [Synechococcus sp.]
MRGTAAASQSLLRRWLLLLCAPAALAAGRALLLPPRPRVEPLVARPYQEALRRAGLPSRLLPALPARNGYDRSHSSVLSLSLATGGQLRLMRGRVRERRSFQVAVLTRGIPALNLSARRLEGPAGAVARGRIQGQPALQTCLVVADRGPLRTAVTRAELQAAVDQRADGRRDRLPVWLGLQPARPYSCLLVTLVGRDRHLAPVALWQRLLPVLAAELQRQS